MLAPQELFKDSEAFENYRREFQEYVKGAYVKRRTPRHITSQALEVAYFGDVGLECLSKMRLPLHFLTGSTSMTVQLNMVLSQVDKSTPGCSSKKTCDSREYPMFCPEAKEDLCIGFGGKIDPADGICKWVTAQRRANSVSSLLNSFSRAGETYLHTDKVRHNLLSKMSEGETYRGLFANLYLWLQKCILAYTVDGTRQLADMLEAEVVKVTSVSMLAISSVEGVILNIDGFSDLEQKVLLLGTQGADATIVTRDGLEDIFSHVLIDTLDYMFVTREDSSHTIRHRASVMSPEVAHSTILQIANKLGAISQWVEISRMMRGLAVFNQLAQLIPEGGHLVDENSSIMKMPFSPDRGCSSLMGEITGISFCDEYGDTNLPASSACLILECIVGQCTMNNVHYVSEAYGLSSKHVYSPDNEPSRMVTLSLMRECKFTTLGPENRLNTLLFRDCGNGLWGAEDRLRNILAKHTHALYQARRARDFSTVQGWTWLPLNVFCSPVKLASATALLGAPMTLDKASTGPFTTNINHMDRVASWLGMHMIEKEMIPPMGLSRVGSTGHSEISSDSFVEVAAMGGTYKKTHHSVGLLNHLRMREGYDTACNDMVYYTRKYFSGGVATRGSDKSEPLVVDPELGAFSAAVADTEEVAEIRSRELATDARRRGRKTYPDRPEKPKYRGTLMERMPTIEPKAKKVTIADPKGKSEIDGGLSYLLPLEDPGDIDASIGVVDSEVVRALDSSLLHQRFREMETVGDGLCAVHALATAIYAKSGDDVDYRALCSAVGVTPDDARWMRTDQIAAVAEVVGRPALIFDVDQETILDFSAHDVGKEDRTYLKYEGGHFTALVPDEEGMFDISRVRHMVRMKADPESIPDLTKDELKAYRAGGNWATDF
jgi:hypothetical protein